jgi:Flp pilus assembly protein TadG
LSRILKQFRDTRGQALIEFTVAFILVVILLVGVIEVGRLVLVYTTITNAAADGVRYGIVHGADSPATTSDIQTVVTNRLTWMNTASPPLTITVTNAGGTVGSTVTVSIVYAYDPITYYVPLHLNLSSTSTGVITF